MKNYKLPSAKFTFKDYEITEWKNMKERFCFFTKASLMTDSWFWCNILIYPEQFLRTDLFFQSGKVLYCFARRTQILRTGMFVTDILFWCNILNYLEQLLRTDLFFRV